MAKPLTAQPPSKARPKPKPGSEASGRPSPGAALTVAEAWQMIGPQKITRQALYLGIDRGDFPSVRLGRRILIPRAAFEAWLAGAKPASAA